jgi:hypothetical protein
VTGVGCKPYKYADNQREEQDERKNHENDELALFSAVKPEA